MTELHHFGDNTDGQRKWTTTDHDEPIRKFSQLFALSPTMFNFYSIPKIEGAEVRKKRLKQLRSISSQKHYLSKGKAAKARSAAERRSASARTNLTIGESMEMRVVVTAAADQTLELEVYLKLLAIDQAAEQQIAEAKRFENKKIALMEQLENETAVILKEAENQKFPAAEELKRRKFAALGSWEEK